MPTVIMIPFIIVGLRITAIIPILRRRKTGTTIRLFAEVGEVRLPPNHAKVIVFDWPQWDNILNIVCTCPKPSAPLVIASKGRSEERR